MNSINELRCESTDPHQTIQLLLPWYLKNALGVAEQQQVARHLRTCLLCRRELLSINKLADAVAQSTDLDVAADASFANIRAKLQALGQQPSPAPIPSISAAGKRGRNRLMNPWASIKALPKLLSACTGHFGKPFALAVAMLLALLPLSLQDWDVQPTTGYYTLSAGKPTQASGIRLHVVFAKDLPETRINEMLAKIHGRLIGEPNSVGAYTVQLNAATGKPDAAAAIAFLRKHKEVQLAESALDELR